MSAISNLKAVKEFILLDQKIDISEIDNLVRFIHKEEVKYGYSGYNLEYFKHLLYSIGSDGKITEEEQEKVIKEINKLIKYLIIEKIKTISIFVLPILFISGFFIIRHSLKML